MYDYNFFFHPAGDRRAYCSVCGQPILQDHYNLVKHSRACSFDKGDVSSEILEPKSYHYTFHRTDKYTATLVILEPELLMTDNLVHNHYRGHWRVVYTAHFRPNTTQVDEQGLYDLRLWVTLIDEGRVKPVGTEGFDPITDVFPNVPDVHSLSMFVYFYTTQGFPSPGFVPDQETIDRHLSPRMDERWGSAECPGRRGVTLGDTRQLIYSSTLQDAGRELTVLRIYRWESYDPRLYFFSFVLSSSYELLWKNRRLPLQKILALPFANWNGIHTLTAVLCRNYHKGWELTAKSDLPLLTEQLIRGRGFKKEPDPWTYRSPAEFYGLPMKILRSTEEEILVSEDNRHRLAAILRERKGILEGIRVTHNVMNFLNTFRVLDDDEYEEGYRRRGLGEWSKDDKTLRRVLAYVCRELTDRLDLRGRNDFIVYRDYLHMRDLLHEGSLTPKDLWTAHDELTAKMNRRAQQRARIRNLCRTVGEKSMSQTEVDTLFKNSVDKYSHLAWDPGEANSEFFLRVPKSCEEMREEGLHMHHCVATYIPQVVHGMTRILFMRSYKEPDKSLVTIEVDNDNYLVQVKAFANRAPSGEQKAFVRNWCRTMRINYSICRDLLR